MHSLTIPRLLLNFLLLLLCYLQLHQVMQGITMVEAGVGVGVEEEVIILGAEVGIMVGVEEARATMARLMEMLRQLLLLVVTIMEPDRKHLHVDFVENNTGTA